MKEHPLKTSTFLYLITYLLLLFLTYLFRSFINGRRVVHRVTTSDHEWYNERQRMATSDTTTDNEWQRVVQQMKTNESE